MITFREIKSGPVAFLGLLSLKPYFTIETTMQDIKWRERRLLMKVKARRRALMMVRRVRRVSIVGKARRREGTQDAQFSRLFINLFLFRIV